MYSPKPSSAALFAAPATFDNTSLLLVANIMVKTAFKTNHLLITEVLQNQAIASCAII
jgi:hypothetical protein